MAWIVVPNDVCKFRWSIPVHVYVSSAQVLANKAENQFTVVKLSHRTDKSFNVLKDGNWLLERTNRTIICWSVKQLWYEWDAWLTTAVSYNIRHSKFKGQRSSSQCRISENSSYQYMRILRNLVPERLGQRPESTTDLHKVIRPLLYVKRGNLFCIKIDQNWLFLLGIWSGFRSQSVYPVQILERTNRTINNSAKPIETSDFQNFMWQILFSLGT